MKQVILLRDDLDMSKGKAVAQGSHVSVFAFQEADPQTAQEWLRNGGKKITLAVESEEQLEDIMYSASDLPTGMVRDRGYTELPPDTLTAGAIGPANEEAIDHYTGNLPVYK